MQLLCRHVDFKERARVLLVKTGNGTKPATFTSLSDDLDTVCGDGPGGAGYTSPRSMG
jgi:hypothetical protein